MQTSLPPSGWRFCAPFAAPKPAFRGVNRVAISEPSALNCGLIQFPILVARRPQLAIVVRNEATDTE
jgi:hypothetical protein